MNFNLSKSGIYLAIRWKSFFGLAKLIKKVFFILIFVFALGFFIVFFNSVVGNESLDVWAKVFLAFFLFCSVGYTKCWLLGLFFDLHLKTPRTKGGMADLISNPERYNVADFLSFDVGDAVNTSIKMAENKNLSSSHLFYNLILKNPEFSFVFSRLLVDINELKNNLKEHIKSTGLLESSEPFDDSFKNTMLNALEISNKNGHAKIEAGDIITALTKFDPVLKRILIEFDLKPEDIQNLSWWLEDLKKRADKNRKFWEYENLAKKGTLAKSWTAGYTIHLDKYSIDWTEKARKDMSATMIGHLKEMDMMERILAGQGINNVLLIGEPGVGKERMVLNLAKKSILGIGLEEVNYKRIIELDMVSLLASIENLEEVEIVLDTIFKEAIGAGNIILVINNFNNYVGQEMKPGIVDIAGVISQYLQLPQCQLIAITTYDGLHRNIEKNPSLLSLFEKVEVPELSKEETLMLLEDMALELEDKYKKIISYPALRQIVELSERYMPDASLPQKAIKILDDVSVYVSGLSKDNIVLPKHVAKVLTEKTEIPVGEIESKEKDILLNLENLIHKRIVNQEEAVKEVSNAMRRARSEVTIRKGPIGTFIFLGPTGVGKTETSKALAEVYFGSEEKMIRLDMSEFQSAKDVSRLIGTEGQPGLLTTPVRENPFSVLLLDELEKADFNIRNLFLQVLDEGYIVDGFGKKVDFRNTIIIATSNAGYQIILEALKESVWSKSVKERLTHYLFEQGIFQPEFLNRFDAVVVFKPLSYENILAIANLMLLKLAKNLRDKGVEFVITEPLKKKIADLGYNPVFGAREMRRVVQEKIENVLAPAVLTGKLKRGDRVEINPENFELIIEKPSL
jgi:ATP-dependent Clp protease ATP-binding subunit ClpC